MQCVFFFYKCWTRSRSEFQHSSAPCTQCSICGGYVCKVSHCNCSPQFSGSAGRCWKLPGWAPASVQWKRARKGRGGGSQMSTQSLNTLECMRGWLVKFTHTYTHTHNFTKRLLNTKIWKHAKTHKQFPDSDFDRKTECFVLSQGLNGKSDGSKYFYSSHQPRRNTSAVLQTSTRHQMVRR